MARAASASAAAAVVLFAVLLSSASAHNITHILEQFPDFSSFNDMLNQTGLAAEINRRQTITVLAVANADFDAVYGRPLDVVKKILSVHVVLDYYGPIKLHRLSKKTAILTTLFQTTGVAYDRSGFLNVTDLNDGTVAFGSAIAGAGLDARFIKQLVALPYNISVLQLSTAIVPPGVDINAPPVSPPPPAPLTPPPPKHKKATEAPAPAPADAPASDDADAPEADAPEAEAPSPDADSPASGPAPAATTAAKSTTPEADAPTKSSAARTMVGAGLAVAVGAAFFGAL